MVQRRCFRNEMFSSSDRTSACNGRIDRQADIYRAIVYAALA